jgi:4-hydroxybenzoyl-CoA thioesterase
MTFRVARVVRFEHCDPAGIVFFPRVFALLNEVVEDWFARSLGVDFAALHLRERLGVPTVKIECEFLRASRLGETLDFALDVESLGRASFVLAHAVRCGDELRVHARATLCFVSLDTMRSVPIPEDLRAAMARDLVVR